MTGSNTEPVAVPLWEQANKIVRALATPLFEQWKISDENDPVESQSYNAWFALRKISELFLANRSTRLRTADRELLTGALRIAHELAHDSLPGDAPAVVDCSCRVAEHIRDLVVVIAEDAEMRRAARQGVSNAA
jgi:hypothetical protein